MGVGGLVRMAHHTMEPPAKGRRGYTFAHIDYASVAIFKLSDYINQNIQSICYAYTRRYIDIYIYTHTHIYIYRYAYLYVPRYTNSKQKLY